MRVRWMDNYRGFLALLVVLCHGIKWTHLYEQFLVAEHGYFLMTTIHMPAFFFISGCLAKNSDTLPRILG